MLRRGSIRRAWPALRSIHGYSLRSCRNAPLWCFHQACDFDADRRTQLRRQDHCRSPFAAARISKRWCLTQKPIASGSPDLNSLKAEIDVVDTHCDNGSCEQRAAPLDLLKGFDAYLDGDCLRHHGGAGLSAYWAAEMTCTPPLVSR